MQVPSLGSVVSGTGTTATRPASMVAPSFHQALIELQPNSPNGAPLTYILAMLQKERITGITHTWYVQGMVFPTAKVDGAVLAAATAITVDSNVEVLANKVLLNNTTGELMLVTDVNVNGTGITVQRAFGTTAAADIADNEVLAVVGSAFQEGSLRPASQNLYPVPLYNVTQIIRTAWSVTGSESAIATLVGKNPTASSKAHCMVMHAQDQERAYLFGELYNGQFQGKPMRQMRGLLASIRTWAPSNVFTAGATTNYTQLCAMLDSTLGVSMPGSVGNMSRVVLAGGTAINVIAAIARANGTYQLMEGTTTFGLQFKVFKSQRGTFYLVESPMLNAMAAAGVPGLGSMAVVLELAAMATGDLRPTKPTDYNADGSTAVDDGVDAIGGSLLTETTFIMFNPSGCAIINGLTAGVAG